MNGLLKTDCSGNYGNQVYFIEHLDLLKSEVRNIDKLNYYSEPYNRNKKMKTYKIYIVLIVSILLSGCESKKNKTQDNQIVKDSEENKGQKEHIYPLSRVSSTNEYFDVSELSEREIELKDFIETHRKSTWKVIKDFDLDGLIQVKKVLQVGDEIKFTDRTINYNGNIVEYEKIKKYFYSDDDLRMETWGSGSRSLSFKDFETDVDSLYNEWFIIKRKSEEDYNERVPSGFFYIDHDLAVVECGGYYSLMKRIK